MRLLVMTSTFPVRPDDGIPRFVLDLAEALAVHAEVSVLAPDAPGACLHERFQGVHVERFRYFWPRAYQRLAITNQRGMRDNLRSSWLAKLQVPLFLWREASVLRKLLKRQDFHVVNAHWLVPQGLVAAWVLRHNRSIQLILHIHAGDVYLLKRLPFGRRVAKYVVGRADVIFAAGSHVRDTLNELVGRDCGAKLQPMGVHLDRFRQPTDLHVINDPLRQSFPEGFLLFVGRFVAKKGLTYLLQAMAAIHPMKPGLGLVLAGYGPEEQHLRDLVARLNLTDNVVFVGHQTHQQVIDLMHACRVVVVPSIIDDQGETEGMPTVVTEAMAAGALVVASDVAGIPDVIRHGENGWICCPRDTQDLTAKIIDALHHRDVSPIRQAAVATAANYDWQQVARNYMASLTAPSAASS